MIKSGLTALLFQTMIVSQLASRLSTRRSASVCVTALSTTAPAYRSLSSTLASQLEDPSLLASISSSKTDTNSFPVKDPADPDHILGYVPVHGERETKEAILTSSKALPSWRDQTTAAFRGSLLTKWSSLLQSNANDLAAIMTYESGKPLAESKGEVAYAASFLDFYAAEAVRPTGAGGGFLVPTPFSNGADGSPRGQVVATQEAVGVTGLITPWNFPAAMITRKVGPALAAGCTAVVKPSDLTPLTALAMQTLADRAGIPPGVLQHVTASADTTPEVGTALCTDPLVRKISFTGSTRVGKLLMKQSSDTMKRISLELGGNAPFIVFEDAELDQAVGAAMASKFRNAGQTCVCADRFLVHSAIHDKFVDLLREKISGLTMGHGIQDGVTLGPLISEVAVQTVSSKVEAAIQEGAKCLIGGKRAADVGPQFYAPTLLTNVSPASSIWKDETFGPVVAVISFDSDEEALALANDSSVGLASYFCTKDLGRAMGVARKLESGIVGINEGIISSAGAPFGGVKESGLGREGSALGIAEYLQTKYVFVNS